MTRPTRQSYDGYLDEITRLGEAGVRAAFRSLVAERKARDEASELDVTWCQLVCQYFLGYRVAMPIWLYRLSFPFDSLGEFLIVAYFGIGVASIAVAQWANTALACIVADCLAAILWLSTRRAANARVIARAASLLALQNFLPPTFALHPYRFLARRLMTCVSYLLHDLRLLVVLAICFVGWATSVFLLTGEQLAAMLPFYLVGARCAVVLVQDASEVPCFLYLSASGEFPDSRILSIRKSAYPARVLTLVRHEKPRVALAFRSSYVRVWPAVWAQLVWKAIVKLQIAACATVLLDLGEGVSSELQFEVDEVRKRGRTHLTIGRLDNPNGEDLTWISLDDFLRKQSKSWIGSIHGPSG